MSLQYAVGREVVMSNGNEVLGEWHCSSGCGDSREFELREIHVLIYKCLGTPRPQFTFRHRTLDLMHLADLQAV
jgi:hypothetical protein